MRTGRHQETSDGVFLEAKDAKSLTIAPVLYRRASEAGIGVELEL